MCQRCDLRFVDQRERWLHLRRQECREVTRYCCICDWRELRACDLRRHLNRVHGLVYDSELPPPSTMEELRKITRKKWTGISFVRRQHKVTENAFRCNINVETEIRGDTEEWEMTPETEIRGDTEEREITDTDTTEPDEALRVMKEEPDIREKFDEDAVRKNGWRPWLEWALAKARSGDGFDHSPEGDLLPEELLGV